MVKLTSSIPQKVYIYIEDFNFVLPINFKRVGFTYNLRVVYLNHDSLGLFLKSMKHDKLTIFLSIHIGVVVLLHLNV